MKSNSVESVKVDGGEINFDHSTGEMWAFWDNGYSERWLCKGYGLKEKLYSFCLMIEDFDRANSILYGKGGLHVKKAV